jgi:hypothetical protein
MSNAPENDQIERVIEHDCAHTGKPGNAAANAQL